MDNTNEETTADGGGDESPKKPCCTGFGGNSLARGYALNGMGRGAVIASNLFISSSLLYLAGEEAGCIDEEGELIDDCNLKVRGFKPSSFITIIAVISGLLAAITNPITGAVVDFTDHRHLVGTVTSLLIIIIQGIQVYTVLDTWFAMAILQAIAGFLYQILVTMTYAYLPEMAAEVGVRKMKTLTGKFTMVQFSSQMLFMIVVIGTGIGLGADDVLTAQFSQGICVPILLFLWGMGWLKFNPKVKAKRPLPEGSTNLVKAGFVQVYHTAKNINQNYKNSIRWYMVALTFAESGANSFTVCAVTYLNEVVKMSGIETGIAFFIVLLFTIPGAKISERVAKRTNFNTSWRINMVYFSIITAIGSFIIMDENSKIITYIMAVFWGIALGWFYPTENGFFATLVPDSQATEMAGMYNFCTLIISWIPPFVFTAMNEGGVHMKFGLLHLVAYFSLAVIFLSFMPSWDEILQESHGGGGGDSSQSNKKEVTTADNDNGGDEEG